MIKDLCQDAESKMRNGPIIIIQSGKEINGDTREKIFRKGGQRKRDERHYW